MERGQDYILQASADGSTYTDVGKLTGVTLSQEKETISTNNFDSPNDAQSIAGMKNWGMSCEALYVYDDAGQRLIIAAYNSVDPYHFRLTSAADTAGVYRYSGQAHVTSLEREFATNEVAGFSVEFEGTGTLTEEEIPTS